MADEQQHGVTGAAVGNDDDDDHDDDDHDDDAHEIMEGLELLWGGRLQLSDIANPQAWESVDDENGDTNDNERVTIVPQSVDERYYTRNKSDDGGGVGVTTNHKDVLDGDPYESTKVVAGTKTSQIDAATSSSNSAPVDSSVFQFAHRGCGAVQQQRSSQSSLLVLPPVRVVDMNHLNHRGNGLIATESIRKGTVIYTEHAAFATQQTAVSSSSTTTTKQHKKVVRACQYCFRSLEPISSLSMMKEESVSSEELPMQHLWPIPAWTSFVTKQVPVDPQTQQTTSAPPQPFLQEDSYGRIQCFNCQTLFCSRYCCTRFENEYDSCCKYVAMTDALSKIFASNDDNAHGDEDDEEEEEDNDSNTSFHRAEKTKSLVEAIIEINRCAELDKTYDNDSNKTKLDFRDEDNGQVGAETSVQPSVLLAVRMFVYSLQHYRRKVDVKNNKITEKSSSFSVIDDGVADRLRGLCGEASDVGPLEIGFMVKALNTPNVVVAKEASHCDAIQQRVTFTLQPVYEQIVATYDMTDTEQIHLSLDYLHRLAAIAARNGVDVMTQSPFKSYYNSLLRASGGRGSQRHEQIKKQVATALGSKTGTLERWMDHRIDERVAVQVAGLFLLTARINHSCKPNAQIQSQGFVDCHIDLIATNDIEPGEEITISYIPRGHGIGRKRTHQRRRELVSKYLFHCQCIECTTGR